MSIKVTFNQTQLHQFGSNLRKGIHFSLNHESTSQRIDPNEKVTPNSTDATDNWIYCTRAEVTVLELYTHGLLPKAGFIVMYLIISKHRQ